MRTDERGDECPATLGEYRDLCAAIGTEHCDAVELLDGYIALAPRGRDEEVIVPDKSMRVVLMPRLIPHNVLTEPPLPRGEGKVLSQWHVFRGLHHYGDNYVARRLEVMPEGLRKTRDIVIEADLDKLRDMLEQSGFILLPRMPGDPDAMVETWT